MEILSSTYVSLATLHNHVHFATLLFYCKCLLCACSLCTILPKHISQFLSRKQDKIVQVLLLGGFRKRLFPDEQIRDIISE